MRWAAVAVPWSVVTATAAVIARYYDGRPGWLVVVALGFLLGIPLGYYARRR